MNNTLQKEMGRIKIDLLLVGCKGSNKGFFFKQNYNSFALLEIVKDRSFPIELMQLVKKHKDYKPLSQILLDKVK